MQCGQALLRHAKFSGIGTLEHSFPTPYSKNGIHPSK
jgi:hypothetical protein